jgi:divalent metal cation (Fe/Co/Zn/Cd) transporter
VKKSVTTKRVLITSFAVDALDTLVNVVIAIITGSAVMLAESLQGFADLTSVTMLLIGFERSKKRSNKQHPFGYGKELYFWAILSVFIIIGITATLSFYSGLQKWRNPTHIEHVAIAYAALSVAIITNSYAFWLSLQKLLNNNPLKKFIEVFLQTSDTTKSLVTGRSASKQMENEIKDAALNVPQVKKVLDLRTMMMGTSNTLINLEVHLKDGLTTDQVEKVIDNIRENIQKKIPGRTHISIEPETPTKQNK